MRENVGRDKAREAGRKGAKGGRSQKGDAEELWPP